MNQAHGIIYIDKESKKSCPNLVVPQVVLVNPFDQRNVEKVQVESVRNKYQLDTSKTIYAIIGNIFPIKGVDFVAEAFIEAQMDDAILLIVGRDTNKDGYEDKVKAIANGRQNIRFLGELTNMDELYRVIDFVVRGDLSPGVGRTTMESLFSGAGVILPGVRSENLDSLCIDPNMSQRVFYYSPRNKSELISLFQQTNGTKYSDRTYSSNLEEYTEKFLGFVKNVF
jgi:glycosyltransferase involved in cell wall biosynthesis